jgi:tetratricopeptide (TPR) repeat protein
MGQKLRYILTGALIIAISGLFLACSDENNTNKSEYDLANRYITEGQYNAAIALMESRVTAVPQDNEARRVLASAYAARAGIFMGQYFDIMAQIVERIKKAEDYLNSVSIFDQLEKDASGNTQKSIFSTLERIYRAIFNVQQIIGIFALIPELTEEQKRDLSTAVKVMSHNDSFTQGALLYRGMLRLVLLKNNFRDKYDMSHLKRCKVNITHLLRQLSEMRFEVNGMLLDFARGGTRHSRSSQLEASIAQVDGSLQKAIQGVQGLAGLGEIDVKPLTKTLGGSCQ